MFIQDEALIYHHQESLYYAITKKHGKLILKNIYFKDRYPCIKSFYYVSYEYTEEVMQKSNYINAVVLSIMSMELDYIIPLQDLGDEILLFIKIFNYCIEFKISIESIYNELYNYFFLSHHSQEERLRTLYYILCHIYGTPHDINNNQYEFEIKKILEQEVKLTYKKNINFNVNNQKHNIKK
jgi:hypothetical protein